MRRALPIAAVALAALALLVLAVGAAGGDDDGYRVRAIFDNAGFVVPGEDVKVAGVTVGLIESVDVTRDRKAAVVLKIEDEAFQDFKRDATCEIRLQSLIGEKFVACRPTVPRGANARPAPPLRRIGDGEHEGQHLLPVENTSSPVDLDLLNNIMRLPQRQRLAIIINELGVGLAGNGEELGRVIRRANPALREFDRVLDILASQNRVLADLARDSDRALAPVARETASIQRFIAAAGDTARATAAEGDALEANFERLPRFLQELTPTARRLGELAAAGAPVMADLRAAAPGINRVFEQLGPFSEAALPAVRTLGDASDVAARALTRAQPVIRDIRGFGEETRPLARSLARGLVDLRENHGIDRLLQTILYLTGATNGFDGISHYLRSFYYLQANCTTYKTVRSDDCASNFSPVNPVSRATASAVPEETQAVPDTTAEVSPSTEARPEDDARAGLLGYLLGGGGEE